jgi:hypothetical protein
MYWLGMIKIFSGTDMIKIRNWFKAIGSFVRKIKEKNTSADLSWYRNVSHRCRSVLVPICPRAEAGKDPDHADSKPDPRSVIDEKK